MRILCPTMVRILLPVRRLCASFSFHFPFPALIISVLMNPGKVLTVPSHCSSKDFNSSSYAAEPDLVDKL